MSLTVETNSDLAQQAARFANINTRTEADIQALAAQTARQLLDLEKTIVHVKTGRLQAGLEVEGPTKVATGEFVSVLAAPAVPYAEDEAGLGSTHDFARRTIIVGQSIIDGATTRMAGAIISAVEGR